MAKREVVGESLHDRGWTLMRMRVPCGRKTCRKCPHGPYWYAQRRMGRHVVEQYVGKTLEKWVKRRGARVGAEVLAEWKREKGGGGNGESASVRQGNHPTMPSGSDGR